MRLATASLQCVALAASATLCATVCADTYRYEIQLGGTAYQSTSTTQILLPVSNETLTSKGRAQDDQYGIGGTWYFADVEPGEGPLQRAAFVDRASSFHLGYRRGDGSFKASTTTGDPPVNDVIIRSDQKRNDFDAGFNYVWKGSGWSVGASAARTELEFRGEDLAFDYSGHRYSVGGGKYIGETTWLGLNVQRMDVEGDYTTAAALTFTHVGDLGATWQYSTDLSVSDEFDTDSDGGFGAGFTVHPSRALAIGFNVSGPLQNTSDGTIGYWVFASWFPTERVGMTATYNWSDVAEPDNTDIDADAWGANVFFRF